MHPASFGTTYRPFLVRPGPAGRELTRSCRSTTALASEGRWRAVVTCENHLIGDEAEGESPPFLPKAKSPFNAVRRAGQPNRRMRRTLHINNVTTLSRPPQAMAQPASTASSHQTSHYSSAGWRALGSWGDQSHAAKLRSRAQSERPYHIFAISAKISGSSCATNGLPIGSLPIPPDLVDHCCMPWNKLINQPWSDHVDRRFGIGPNRHDLGVLV